MLARLRKTPFSVQILLGLVLGVVLEGVAGRATDPERIAAFVAAVNAKYDAGMTTEFQDPAVNGTFAVTPVRVFALSGADFPGSPTRWRFPANS